MYLYGASGHAKVIIDILLSNNQIVEGIFDDNISIKQLLNFTVHGIYDPLLVKNSKLIISIGDNELRLKISNKVTSDFGTAIHKSASVSQYSTVNIGTVIMQNAVIQSDVVVGKHAIINTSAIVEHDCLINDFVHISPNATICGNVKVGELTHVGAGSIVLPGVTIGRSCIIGAGAIIVDDIPDNVVVVGNPGRIIKKR